MDALTVRKPDPLQNRAIDAEMLARFVAFLDRSPATMAAYAKNIRRFYKYMAEHGITQPVRGDVIAYREQLKTTGHKPATVQAYIVALRRFFEWTASEGLYPNVSERLKGAKIDGQRFKRDALTPYQAKALLQEIERDTVNGSRDYAMLAVMLTGGLRTIEVIRANVEDVRTLGDGMVLYVQGKGYEDRSPYIKLVPKAEIALREYMQRRGALPGTAPLFGSASNRDAGERMTTRSIRRIVKARMRAVGIESDRLTAHSLRHTAGTINMRNGGTLQQTQQLLRHSNINTTMIYVHNLEREANDSEARIGAAIF